MKFIETKLTRRVCRECGERKARFRYRGAVRSDRFHHLCFRCYRSLLNAAQSRGAAAQRARWYSVAAH